MATTTRWHRPSCGSPEVVVDGDVPECRTCGSNASALLRRAAEEPAESYSGITEPPEAPIGQIDLRWPPYVPYTRNGVLRAQPVVSSEDATNLAPAASDSSLSSIYTSTLGKDWFRLLYLSVADRIDSPIHGKLVEHQHANCPEYETTSYTWGGEDRDATPRRPAYLGDFWDVLFLTHNCWSLLQYLRSQVITRLVWVDAICINQNNIQERGAQVASMPDIYRNCMRVVIYPGDHLVRKHEHRSRQRIRHDDKYSLDATALEIRKSVLQSWYITRVWIIQELILAPSAILALENHDLYLENSSLHRASEKNDRKQWLEFMGRDYRLRQSTLHEALRKTFGSQATDLRDRIFGILGILGANPTYSGIVPDYSISMRDCVIGAMGHTLLTSKEIWPLLQAPAFDTTSPYPSWVASLEDIPTWINENPEIKAELRLKHPGSVRGSITIAWSEHGQETQSMEPMFITLPHCWTTVIGLEQSAAVSDYAWAWKRPKNLTPALGFTPDFLRLAHHTTALERLNFHEPPLLLLGPEMPWCQDASIDSSCGALTIRLVRVFDKPHKIVENIEERDHSAFLVNGLSAAAWFSGPKSPKKSEQPCYVFLAFRAKTTHLDKKTYTYSTDSSHLRTFDIYLIFATEAGASGRFKLVSCSRLDDMVFLSESPPPPPTPPPPPPRPIVFRWESAGDRVLSLFDTLREILNYNSRVRRSHNRVKEPDNPAERKHHLYEKRVLGSISDAMLFDMLIPGKGATAPGLLQLSLSAARTWEPVRVTEEFRRAYTACLQSAPAEFNPVLDDEYVWFTLMDVDALRHYWASLIEHISDVSILSGLPLNYYGQEVTAQWRPWETIFPHWFDLQIPDIGKTEFDEEMCIRVRLDLIQGYEHQRPLPCGQHQDYEPQGHMGLHHWFPCGAESREIQIPVRARMPLDRVVEAIRETRLNWLHRYLLAFGEKMSEDVEVLLDRGPRPEDSNLYLYDWPKPLVDELGFVWRNELVTFV